MAGEQTTGTSDVMFNLISVIYHALDAADICDDYLADAEESDNQELVQFFEEVISENRRMAEQGKDLLRRHLGPPSEIRPEPQVESEIPTH